MTCIVGVCYAGGVVLGADSCGSNGWTYEHQPRRKLARIREKHEGKDLVFGVTGTYRLADALQHCLELPERSRSDGDSAYVRGALVKSIRTALKDAGLLEVRNQVEAVGSHGSALLAYGGRLYALQGDLSVLDGAPWGAAIGSGFSAAHAALITCTRRDGECRSEEAATARAEEALTVASECVTTVRPPFYFEAVEGAGDG